jgi:hypothetical protein
MSERVGMREAIAHFMGKPGDCCPANQSGTDEQQNEEREAERKRSAD